MPFPSDLLERKQTRILLVWWAFDINLCLLDCSKSPSARDQYLSSSLLGRLALQAVHGDKEKRKTALERRRNHIGCSCRGDLELGLLLEHDFTDVFRSRFPQLSAPFWTHKLNVTEGSFKHGAIWGWTWALSLNTATLKKTIKSQVFLPLIGEELSS